MKKASVIVLIIAILYALIGVVAGLAAQKDADEALVVLEMADDGELLLLDDGTEITVENLRSEIQSEVTMTYVIMFGLSAVMLACWFWSRKSPLPALVTAFAIYLTVIALSAIAEPSSLVSGLLLKVVVITALIAGIRAALTERAALDRI